MQTSPVWPPTPDDVELVHLCEAAADALVGCGAPALRREDTLPAAIAAIHIVRCSRTLAAIANLCASGFAVEAAALVRCILEDLVSLAYLSLEPGTRADEWVAHGEDLSYVALCRVREHGGQVPDIERAQQLDKLFADRKPQMWWSNKSPSQKATALKESLPEVYDDFAGYEILSLDVHTNFKTGERYVVESNDVVHLVVAPSNQLIPDRIAVAVHLGRRLAWIASGLGVEIDLSALGTIAGRVASLHPLFALRATAPGDQASLSVESPTAG